MHDMGALYGSVIFELAGVQQQQNGTQSNSSKSNDDNNNKACFQLGFPTTTTATPQPLVATRLLSHVNWKSTSLASHRIQPSALVMDDDSSSGYSVVVR